MTTSIPTRYYYPYSQITDEYIEQLLSLDPDGGTKWKIGGRENQPMFQIPPLSLRNDWDEFVLSEYQYWMIKRPMKYVENIFSKEDIQRKMMQVYSYRHILHDDLIKLEKTKWHISTWTLKVI